MKPFPPLDQLAFLIGAEVTNVTLQPYHVDFRFEDGTLLVVEHGLEYIDEQGRASAYDPQQRLASHSVSFHALILDRIAQVHVEAFRLALVFESGRQLVVLSKSGPYESGHVGRKDKGSIIF
jgi:hypothetical protein